MSEAARAKQRQQQRANKTESEAAGAKKQPARGQIDSKSNLNTPLGPYNLVV